MDDIFCKIIRGEIPCSKVYEDDDVLAFLDISQATKGHTLVVPKAHCTSMLDCPKDSLHKVYDVAQRIAQAMGYVLGAEGFNILTNAGEVAGQSVPHFHVHVIPRYTGKEGGFMITMKEGSERGDLKRLAYSLSEAIEAK